MYSVLSIKLFLAATVGTGACVVIAHLLRAKHDPREPPLAPANIPFIGHVIGIMRKKFKYYAQLSQQSPYPIFTLAMPGSKMYVVTTPELIQAVQKQPKALAFPPIEAKFASTVCGSSADAHKILMKNVNGDEGDWGLSMESYAAMRTALSPGPGLDGINRVMVDSVTSSLESIRPSKGKVTTVELAGWLRNNITLATTNSVYGPGNPFKDKAVVDAFWQFESQLVSILLGVFPTFFARKGLSGRAKVSAAFEAYFRNGQHEHSSTLTRNRYETSLRNGISIQEIAKYEVGGAIAVLVNTTPAVFWMLLLIYSHPGLLGEIREEVDSTRTSILDRNGVPIYCLDISTLKTKCPLLASTFQEVLRYKSMGTSIRLVMQDTLLNGQWLLKKDCMIQMPSYVIHKDPSLWGFDVDDFNPRRFMKDGTVNARKPNAAAFRAFGGGTTLCPGRHFATNEILAAVSMFVVRYDMEPVSGKWSMPTAEGTNVAAVIMEPDTDIDVAIRERRGYEGTGWSFSLKDSEDIFAVVAEDKTG